MMRDKFIGFGTLMLFGTFIWLLFTLFSCSIAFHNISTHGTATLDEDQTTQPDIQTEIPFPPMTGML